MVAACSGVRLPVMFASASAPGLSWGAVVGRRSEKKVGMEGSGVTCPIPILRMSPNSSFHPMVWKDATSAWSAKLMGRGGPFDLAAAPDACTFWGKDRTDFR